MKAKLFNISRCFLLITVFLSCLCMNACSATCVTVIIKPKNDTQETLYRIDDVNIPLVGGTNVLNPSRPGTISFSSRDAKLDASNAAEGYVLIKYGGGGRAKVQITCDEKTTYTYDLRTDGKYEVFPLTSGNGKYQINVYYKLYDEKYALELAQSIDVQLRDSMLPFLYPNKLVNFSADSQTVVKADKLAQTAENDITVVSNIYNYVIGNISYDTEKAQMAIHGKLSGYIPDVDNILTSKKGICFDYAAVMTTMLRSQQIPTRMEFGYVSGGAYHAWISTYITDVGWVNNAIQFDGKSWKLMDPTFAASYGANSQYVGTGISYKTRYCY